MANSHTGRYSTAGLATLLYLYKKWTRSYYDRAIRRLDDDSKNVSGAAVSGIYGIHFRDAARLRKEVLGLLAA